MAYETVTGLVRMTRREELLLMATANLEATASAWMAKAMALELYQSQADRQTVAEDRFEFLSRWLDDEYDDAVHAFRRSDELLRREIAKEDGRIELADPFRLEEALIAARLIRLERPFVKMFLEQIASAASLASVDRQGAEWLLRFFAIIGHKPPVEEERAKRRHMASDEQLTILRSMFRAYHGEIDREDRNLTGWIAGRYEISALRFLDAETAWKAIVRLREYLIHRQPVAA